MGRTSSRAIRSPGSDARRARSRARLTPLTPLPMLSRVALALSVAIPSLAACSHDVVLPDQAGSAVCGDGIVEAGEGCDTKSPGCVDCAVVPGWTCPDNACSLVCGDGIVGTGGSCANPRRASACDMTGFWAVRETDFTCDALFNNPQTSSNWYLYEISQSGDFFQITADLDCGVHVTGSAVVDYTTASLRAVMYENPMDGRGPHGMRHGTSAASEGGCSFSLERWYQIRGAVDSLLPANFQADVPLASLSALPSVSDPLGDPGNPAGATDPDGDGFPGIATQLSGLVSGVRDAAQRVWKQYATVAGTPIPSGALRFQVPGDFDLQDNVLHVSQCGKGCDLLTTPAPAAKHGASITLAFLGKSLTSARVAATVAGEPGKSIDADLATCANLRLVLPHDPSAPDNACMP